MRRGKGRGLTQCLSHRSLVHICYPSSWMLVLIGACQVWQKCPWSCMWVYGYKATYRVTLGRVCEVEKAAEGQPQVAVRKVSQCWGGAPFFLSSVHGGPTVSRPQDCSAEQVDRPQTGPCLFRL